MSSPLTMGTYPALVVGLLLSAVGFPPPERARREARATRGTTP